MNRFHKNNMSERSTKGIFPNRRLLIRKCLENDSLQIKPVKLVAHDVTSSDNRMTRRHQRSKYGRPENPFIQVFW